MTGRRRQPSGHRGEPRAAGASSSSRGDETAPAAPGRQFGRALTKRRLDRAAGLIDSSNDDVLSDEKRSRLLINSIAITNLEIARVLTGHEED